MKDTMDDLTMLDTQCTPPPTPVSIDDAGGLQTQVPDIPDGEGGDDVPSAPFDLGDIALGWQTQVQQAMQEQLQQLQRRHDHRFREQEKHYHYSVGAQKGRYTQLENKYHALYATANELNAEIDELKTARATDGDHGRTLNGKIQSLEASLAQQEGNKKVANEQISELEKKGSNNAGLLDEVMEFCTRITGVTKEPQISFLGVLGIAKRLIQDMKDNDVQAEKEQAVAVEAQRAAEVKCERHATQLEAMTVACNLAVKAREELLSNMRKLLPETKPGTTKANTTYGATDTSTK
jgi:hypothetical protein